MLFVLVYAQDVPVVPIHFLLNIIHSQFLMTEVVLHRSFPDVHIQEQKTTTKLLILTMDLVLSIW
jgi:hypothetical protein